MELLEALRTGNKLSRLERRDVFSSRVRNNLKFFSNLAKKAAIERMNWNDSRIEQSTVVPIKMKMAFRENHDPLFDENGRKLIPGQGDYIDMVYMPEELRDAFKQWCSDETREIMKIDDERQFANVFGSLLPRELSSRRFILVDPRAKEATTVVSEVLPIKKLQIEFPDRNISSLQQPEAPKQVRIKSSMTPPMAPRQPVYVKSMMPRPMKMKQEE